MTLRSPRKGVVRVLLALLACAAAAFAAAPGAQAATDTYLKIEGVEGEYSSGSTCDFGSCTEVYSWRWSGLCAACSGVPISADFQVVLGGAPFDAARCLTRRVSGSLTFTSTDPLYPPETTVTPVSGRLRDHKGFVAEGTASTGALAGYSLSVFVGFPPNPCQPGDFDAAVAISPSARR